MRELHPNLIKIAQILSDLQYHSGTALGESLNVSRSAIWKTIKKLRLQGIPIECVKGKGYILSAPLVLLNKPFIKKNLKPLDKTVFDLQIFESLPSTIDYLQQNPSPRHKIKICMAETQTHGRGRLQRSWYSPFGKNIYLSCRYPFQKDLCELSGLSLVTALSVYHTLRDCGVSQELKVQWPNHILWRQKKLAGCLIDINAEAHGACHAIISIGVNINSLPTDDERFQGTSLAHILGEAYDRNKFCVRLLYHLFKNMRKFEQGGFALFREEWITHDLLIQQSVVISHCQHQLKGQAIEINENGYLLLQTAEGAIHMCTSGDSALA